MSSSDDADPGEYSVDKLKFGEILVPLLKGGNEVILDKRRTPGVKEAKMRAMKNVLKELALNGIKVDESKLKKKSNNIDLEARVR